MSDKHEWRKKEKSLYLPKAKPEVVDVPEFNFITINGAGSPAEKTFILCIEALYSIAYGIKMHAKKEQKMPAEYCDFTVYPLEGIWDLNDKAKENFTGTINKQDLVYKLMIRQPNFIDQAFFDSIVDRVKQKKSNLLLKQVKFETLTEGKCIQMLHLGRFEDEGATFEIMEAFALDNNLKRLSKIHREIYLSDARKVAPEKLKTVLRFNVE